MATLRHRAKSLGLLIKNRLIEQNNPHTFYNWYHAKNLQDFWLIKFINHRIGKHKHINFFSCFNNKVDYVRAYKGVNIFFTGENLENPSVAYRVEQYADHRLEEMDLALGFTPDITHPNYLRFPLWLMHRDFIDPTSDLEQIKQWINSMNSLKNRMGGGRINCSVLVASHDNGGIRTKLIELIEDVMPVVCAGAFRNNTNELKEKYGDDKETYLKQFRFSICPENSLGKGYITEKIFESIRSGCIPIYWGDGLEEGILNPQAILRYEEGREDEFVSKLRQLAEDPEAYQRFIEIPPFEDGAAEKIWEKLGVLEEKLRIVLK